MRPSLLWILLALGLMSCQKGEAKSPVPAPASQKFAEVDPKSWEGAVWKLVSSETFKTMQGPKWSLAQHPEAQIIFVNFWGTYCPPCIAEMPLLDSLFKSRAGQIAVLGLSEEDSSDLGRFLKRKPVQYPITLLSDAQIQSQALSQVSTVPQTLVFNRKGQLIGNIDGMLEKAQLETILEAAEGKGMP